MTLRQLFCEYLCSKPKPEHTFTILRHRSRQHMLMIIRRQFPNATIHIADSDYSEPNVDEFNAWLLEDQIDTKAYHPEWYDCDDFARALRCKLFWIGQRLKTTLTVAYCEGYAGDYHAYNMLVAADDAIYIIEPQNDQCVSVDESKYRTEFIQL